MKLTEEIEKLSKQAQSNSIIEVEKEDKKNDVSSSIFEKPQEIVAVNEDKNSEILDKTFNDAIQYSVATNDKLKQTMLDTAEKYVDTKANIIKTKVDTEHKEAIFNNQADACESYGFNEKTTPIWAVNVMSWGYTVILAIWLFIGTFTFMPVIFIAKKIKVGIKSAWLAGVVALILYLLATLLPILVATLR